MNMTLLENKIIDIAEIKPHPKNYRKHSQQQIEQLMASLARFGQARSICVQQTGADEYTIVAGEGIWKAATWLGWKILKADVFPGHVSATDIRAYLIADNRLQGQDADEEALLLLLQEQDRAGFSLAMIGSSEQELQVLERQFQQSRWQVEQLVEELPKQESVSITPPLPASPQHTDTDVPETFAPQFVPKTIEIIPPTNSMYTPQEWKERFDNNLVRQITMHFTVEEYAWMIKRLKQIRELARQSNREIDTNTDVMVYLLQEYIVRHRLSDLDVPSPFQEYVYVE